MQSERALANIQRAYRACGPYKYFPMGDPQAIADFNAAERRRRAKTPYGRHVARVKAFNASSANDHLTDEEFDALLNKTAKESYQQYLQEIE